jgi:signal transduction histidine kinase
MTEQRGGGARLIEGLGKYHLEIRHVTILFIVILVFQIVVSFLHKASLQKSLASTQELYQQDSAERLANLTTTSLELLLEAVQRDRPRSSAEVERTVQSFNIILSQQALSQTVEELCILIPTAGGIGAIDDGQVLYRYMFEGVAALPPLSENHARAVEQFERIRDEIVASEEIRTVLEGRQTFHVFVPFVPRGEFVGVVYMRNTPDFSTITHDIVSGYDETSMTFSALILFGLLAMFYISSYTLRERNEAQRLLFEKEKERLTEQIDHQKETLFTKRIYHTHHKAEKVMGFIKEDLRALNPGNIDAIKARVNRYANFIARVIYDMKWYDPPVQTVRGPLFTTDLNEVLRFLVANVFQRVSTDRGEVRFRFALDPGLPPVHVNEFVAWEVFEPIIQNCIVHAGTDTLEVSIRTERDAAAGVSRVAIADNGKGIAPELLEASERGVKRIFLEHVTTSPGGGGHSGYGAYIAHEIATQRLGWGLDAANLPGGGAVFTFTISDRG